MDWVPRLRRYARALVRHPEDADDLVQETLERAWAKGSHWPQILDMRAWLFALMHNLYVDRVRRPQVETVDWDDEATGRLATPPTHDANLHLMDLEAALAQLPADQKEVVLLVALEEMSYSEVAATLDIPIGTVMSRLSRGRERLRVLMEGGSPRQRHMKVVK